MKHLLPYLSIALALVAASCKNKSSEPVKPETVTMVVRPFPDSLARQLDTAVTQLAIAKKCRVTLKMVDDSGAYHTSGYDGRLNKPITDFAGTIDIGSCTKMFTATAILQLVEKNKLSLQDKLTTVLPNDSLYKNLLVIDGKDYIDSVRIVNLLNHTSGFPEYFIEHDDDREIALHGDSTLRFTPFELIALAKKTNKPTSAPGNTFTYCNVNYLLLGLIIEKLTGQTWQQYVQANILDVLGMKHTYFASLNSPANRATGYFKGKESQMPATMAGAAGEIISDLDDMQTFIREWYKGKLFANPATLETVKNNYYHDMAPGLLTYGLGCLNMNGNCLGHAGQTFGFQSYMGALFNNYSFTFGIDDASVSAWDLAIFITRMFKN